MDGAAVERVLSAVRAHASRHPALRRAAARLSYDLLVVLHGIRPTFLLDYAPGVPPAAVAALLQEVAHGAGAAVALLLLDGCHLIGLREALRAHLSALMAQQPQPQPQSQQHRTSTDQCGGESAEGEAEETEEAEAEAASTGSGPAAGASPVSWPAAPAERVCFVAFRSCPQEGGGSVEGPAAAAPRLLSREEAQAIARSLGPLQAALSSDPGPADPATGNPGAPVAPGAAHSAWAAATTAAPQRQAVDGAPPSLPPAPAPAPAPGAARGAPASASAPPSVATSLSAPAPPGGVLRIVLDGLPGLPLQPTLQGLLLGYPVVYDVRSAQEAAAASRVLGAQGLRLYRAVAPPAGPLAAAVAATGADAGGVGRGGGRRGGGGVGSGAGVVMPERDLSTLCAFSVPRELGAAGAGADWGEAAGAAAGARLAAAVSAWRARLVGAVAEVGGGNSGGGGRSGCACWDGITVEVEEQLAPCVVL